MNSDQYSFLRVIAGSLKGRHFDAPKGGDTVRPISDRVKESLFDILAPMIQDSIVLDLYSGTGAIGIESLSRGAKEVTYVEKDPRNIRLIRQNTEELGLSSKVRAVQGTLPHILEKIRGLYSLVFVDPPFPTETVFEILPLLKKQKLIDQNSLIVIQRFRGSKELEFEEFALQRKHKVGDSILWFFKLTEKNE